MTTTKAALTPEEQFDLYKCIRDGDIANVQRIMMLERLPDTDTEPQSQPQPRPIDHRVFESLWHDPGPDATPLHLAVCCLRPSLVAWLLDKGADPNLKAQDKTALQMVDAFELFAPARMQRPEDRLAVIELLTNKE